MSQISISIQLLQFHSHQILPIESIVALSGFIFLSTVQISSFMIAGPTKLLLIALSFLWSSKSSFMYYAHLLRIISFFIILPIFHLKHPVEEYNIFLDISSLILQRVLLGYRLMSLWLNDIFFLISWFKALYFP